MTTTKQTKRAIVLLSGGFDSISALIYAFHNNYAVRHALFFNYGQKNIMNEYQSAKYFAMANKVEFHEVIIPNMPALKSGILEGNSDDESFEVVGRNLLFLAYANMYAHSLDCKSIIIGSTGEDSFPDNNDDFRFHVLNAMQPADREIYAPFSRMKKVDVMQWLYTRNYLEHVISLSYSCGLNGDTAYKWGKGCGKCKDCIERRKAYDDLKMMMHKDQIPMNIHYRGEK